MAAAIVEAGDGGVDSLDVLVATLANSRGARIVVGLGADPTAIRTSAVSSRTGRHAGPGLAEDAKLVIEAMSRRSILNRADADIEDLLIGLAVADCLARPVLIAHGITAVRLVEQLGGPLPE